MILLILIAVSFNFVLLNPVKIICGSLHLTSKIEFPPSIELVNNGNRLAR